MPGSSDEFRVFAGEVHHIRVSWTFWRRLFNKDESDDSSAEEVVRAGDEAYRATGATSELLFVYVRRHMLRGVIIDVCRLGDPKRTGRWDNLNAQRVVETTNFADAPVAARFATDWLTHFHDLLRKQDGMKELRDKSLAHFDLATALTKSPLPDTNIDEIGLAVRYLVYLTNAVSTARDGRDLDRSYSDLHGDRTVEDSWKRDADRLVEVPARGLKTP
jgi:hypothetical protein